MHFIIAHRLRADRILVIENGAIAEMGSHADLIRAHGHYYRFYT
jgi:ABC-type multidrug transport system fused ATPase/permease subunit